MKHTLTRLLPIGLLASLALPSLAEETRTLATVSQLKSGTLAILPDGARILLTGPVAEIADEQSNGSVTVGGTLGADGKSFEVAWVRAVVSEAIGEGPRQLAKGTVLKVVGREQEFVPPEEPEEVLTSWRIQLEDGSQRLLASEDEWSLEFLPAEKVIDFGWVQGRIEASGEKVEVIGDKEKRVAVIGGLRDLFARNAGRFVQASAVYYLDRPTPTAEVLDVQATTRGKVDIFVGSVEPGGTVKKSTAFENYNVGPGPDGFLRLRDQRRFVRESDMEIGHEWLELTGVVVQKGEDDGVRFWIEAPGRSIQVSYGFASDEVSDDVLKNALGRRVTVRGDVETGAIKELTMRSIDGAIVADLPAEGDRPAIAAGTKVKVLDGRTSSEGNLTGLIHEIELADGTRHRLSIAHQDKVQVGEPAAAGFTSHLGE